MKKKYVILSLLLFSTIAFTQFRQQNKISIPSLSLNSMEPTTYSTNHKKTIREHIHASFGFRGGIFSSSIPQFDSVFKSSSGAIYGIVADMNIINNINLEIKYHSFSKSVSRSDEEGTDPDVTTTSLKASWDQTNVTLGPKYFFRPNSNIYPYIGVGFGYFGATLDYERKVVVKGSSPSTVIDPAKHKTYSTFFGLAFEGGMRYLVADESLALFVNGELSLATIKNFRFDDADNTANTLKNYRNGVNFGGFAFTIGFIYVI